MIFGFDISISNYSVFGLSLKKIQGIRLLFALKTFFGIHSGLLPAHQPDHLVQRQGTTPAFPCGLAPQSSAGPAFVVRDRDRDSALSGPINGTGLGLK